MTSKSGASGYLRRDISGERQQWHQTQIRSLAKRLGYDPRKTIVFNERTADPIYRLRVVVSRLDVDAVIAPSAHHFDGNWATVTPELVAVADVITAAPVQTYARWGPGSFPPWSTAPEIPDSVIAILTVRDIAHPRPTFARKDYLK